MAHNQIVGRLGEELAAKHLESRGCSVIDRNWRCTHGELDLVVRDGAVLVFVEVKTRTGARYGHPFEAITPGKVARLRRLAKAWCDESDLWVNAPGNRAESLRIDAVSVLLPPDGPAIIDYLTGIG